MKKLPCGINDFRLKNGIIVLIFKATLIFYKDMNFSPKAFANHKLCLKKRESLYVLKNMAKPLCAYDVLEFKNNSK